MKTCSRCKEQQPEAEFYRNKKAKDGLQSNCRSCHKNTSNKWRDRHPERAKEWLAQWYAVNKSRIAERGRLWRRADTERRRLVKKAWKQRSVQKLRAYAAKRRALELNAMPAWANQFVIEEIYDLARLRTKFLGVKHHVDHIVPLVSPIVCGLHCEANLQVIPAAANLSKGNDWWPDMPG